MRLASISARRPDLAPLDEILDGVYSRRRFLRDSAAATALAALGAGCGRAETPAAPPAPAAPPVNPATAPRIAIVGGGMAGLNTAYKLKKAGLSSTIFEGASRTGGRMFTAKDIMGAGLTTELGGEFIDTSHEEMFALMTEFGLGKIDTQDKAAASLKKETYFINGRHYTQEQAAKAFVPLAKKLQKDYDGLGDVVDFETEGGGTAFDRMSIAAYFDKLGVTGWMRELLDVAYVTEYGLDSGDQAALNFLFMVGTGDLEDQEAFEMLGDSDERYKVQGGNQRVVDELAARVGAQIRMHHRLEAVRSKGTGFTLTFQADGRAVDEDADIVVLTIPFTMLREVKMNVDLPPVKLKAIKELGYGANSKVLVGFKSRPWEKLGYSGATYSDELFQLGWSNSFMQQGVEGGITMYSGGKLSLEAGKGTKEAAAARLLPGFERAYPGASAQRNGKAERMHWPGYEWTKGSYSAYKPGQWTTIAGAEGKPVGNLFFAGEHTSYDFQGFMNGAAQSGLDAAKAVMAKVSGSAIPEKKEARIYSRRQLVQLVESLTDDSFGDDMRLTPAGKFLLVLVGLGVLGYAVWTYRGRAPIVTSGGGATLEKPGSPDAPPAPARTGVLASVRQSGVLRVGMEPDAAPLHFLNNRKQEDGFDFRLAAIVGEGLGAKKIQVVEADYDELPDKLRSGAIDVIMAGYVPDPSIKGIVWSNGYLDFGLCLIVNEAMTGTYRSVRDLAGKRIAIYDDPAAERWVKENISGAKISKFSGDDGWFEAVEKDQADALIYDYPFAAEEIKEHPRTAIVQYNLNQSQYAVGIPEGNFDMVYSVNEAISAFRKTPQYADLMREYLSTTSDVFTKPVAGKKTYTVKAGDTLSKIAGAQLQDTNRWKDIWELNRDRVANENLIYPRLVLIMP
jgi:monoamine oxidase